MGFLRKLDDKVINLLQEAYLWLLDRTGVYLASVQVALFAYAVGIALLQDVNFFLKLLVGALAAANLLFVYIRYIMQDKGQTKIINMSAMSLRDWSFRHAFTFFFLFYIPPEIMIGNYVGFSQTIALLLYNYTFLLMIRDRDKKPFWEPKAKLAYDTI